jgi:hypothetical protein
LSAFYGEAAQGTWTLRLCDAWRGDTGDYNRSRLIFSTDAVPGNTQAAWRYTLPSVGASDYAIYTYTLYATDNLGNRTLAPQTVSYAVDNVAPVITATQLINAAVIAQVMHVLTGTARDGGTVQSVIVSVLDPLGEQTNEQVDIVNGAWMFNLYPTSVGEYRLNVTAWDTAGNSTIAGPYVVQVTTPRLVYLPLVSRNYAAAPDLVVERIAASSPSTVQVVIKNQGSARVADEFWIDFYVAPNPAPTHVNQTWNAVSSQGAVWWIDSTALPRLAPGGVLTLTVGDAYYVPEYSNLRTLPPGTPLYAQVDSDNPDTQYGQVRENHEITGGPYNNILGPVQSTGMVSNQDALPDPRGSPPSSLRVLPKR